jgi:hypothetical protein
MGFHDGVHGSVFDYEEMWEILFDTESPQYGGASALPSSSIDAWRGLGRSRSPLRFR